MDAHGDQRRVLLLLLIVCRDDHHQDAIGCASAACASLCSLDVYARLVTASVHCEAGEVDLSRVVHKDKKPRIQRCMQIPQNVSHFKGHYEKNFSPPFNLFLNRHCTVAFSLRVVARCSCAYQHDLNPGVAKSFAGLFRNSCTQLVPNANHYVQLDQRAEVARAM
jgi:hypothetical protein